MALRARELTRIGWREWVALPELGIPEIKVKVDTGARTSALHAFDIDVFQRGRRRLVRFNVHPFQRDDVHVVPAEAALLGERLVRDTSGRRTLRPVIETTVELLGERWTIELTLVGRDEMGFRMLFGRQAVRNRFVVDPGRSYLGRRKPRRVRRRGKENR